MCSCAYTCTNQKCFWCYGGSYREVDLVQSLNHKKLSQMLSHLLSQLLSQSGSGRKGVQAGETKTTVKWQVLSKTLLGRWIWAKRGTGKKKQPQLKGNYCQKLFLRGGSGRKRGPGRKKQPQLSEHERQEQMKRERYPTTRPRLRYPGLARDGDTPRLAHD